MTWQIVITAKIWGNFSYHVPTIITEGMVSAPIQTARPTNSPIEEVDEFTYLGNVVCSVPLTTMSRSMIENSSLRTNCGTPRSAAFNSSVKACLSLRIWVLDNYSKDVNQVASLYQQMPTNFRKYTQAGQKIVNSELWKKTSDEQISIIAAEKKKMELVWRVMCMTRPQRRGGGTFCRNLCTSDDNQRAAVSYN